MPITKYAEHLMAKSQQSPALLWRGWEAGQEVRLKLISRNAFSRCLMEWPDGMVREMHWAELNRRFRAIGME